MPPPGPGGRGGPLCRVGLQGGGLDEAVVQDVGGGQYDLEVSSTPTNMSDVSYSTTADHCMDHRPVGAQAGEERMASH